MAITIKDINSQTFTVMLDSALTSPPPDPPVAHVAGFVGLTSDQLPTATDGSEYEGWIVTEEEMTGIDWAHNSFTPITDTFSVKHLNQISHPQLSINNHPFIIDTGASVHISPDKSDFLTLHLVQPCSVKGISSTSIIAIRVGDIKLQIAQGT